MENANISCTILKTPFLVVKDFTKLREQIVGKFVRYPKISFREILTHFN